MKSNYETMLKLLKPTSEEQKAKIEAIKKKRDDTLETVKAEMAAEKKKLIDGIKERAEGKRKELHAKKDERLAALQLQQKDRRKTKAA